MTNSEIPLSVSRGGLDSPDVQGCFKDRLCVVQLYDLQVGSQYPISYKLDRSVANYRKETMWVKSSRASRTRSSSVHFLLNHVRLSASSPII